MFVIKYSKTQKIRGITMEIAGILSLVFSIIGLISSYWYVGAVLCLVGIILGIFAATDDFTDKKFPTAGILLSVLGIVMSIYFAVSDLDSGKLLVQADKFKKHEKVEKTDDNFMRFHKEGWTPEQDGIDVTKKEPKKEVKEETNEEQKKKGEENDTGNGVYKKGETANCNGLELTFLGYTESNGTEYNSPADGKVFVFPEFEVYNGTNEKITMDTWTPFLYYCDGYNVESSSSAIFSMTELDLEILTGDIVQGGRMRACLPLELPSDWKEMEIFYKDNYFGDTEFSFVFNK